MQAPERVLGLIVQNAHAHRTGPGREWDDASPTGRNQSNAIVGVGVEPLPEQDRVACGSGEQCTMRE
jgi:hypothetical protein